MNYQIMPFLLLVGFILFVSDFFVYTKSKVEKAVSISKFDKKSQLLKNTEKYISAKVKLSNDKKMDLEHALKILRIDLDVNDYIATIIAKSMIYTLMVMVCGIALKSIILMVLSICLGFFIYYTNYRDTFKKSVEIRTEIEKDLPKLCSVICSNLRHTNNVENILKSYLPIASPIMQAQIEFTLADITISNVSEALIRLDERIHSPMVSDVVRGLISVSNGDDQQIYFGARSIDFRRTYKQTILMEVQKRPSKLLPMQLVIGLFFLGILGYPMILYFSQAQNTILR